MADVCAVSARCGHDRRFHQITLVANVLRLDTKEERDMNVEVEELDYEPPEDAPLICRLRSDSCGMLVPISDVRVMFSNNCVVTTLWDSNISRVALKSLLGMPKKNGQRSFERTAACLILRMWAVKDFAAVSQRTDLHEYENEPHAFMCKRDGDTIGYHDRHVRGKCHVRKFRVIGKETSDRKMIIT